VQEEAVYDAPVSPVDAIVNAYHSAVMQMIFMYIAEFTINSMSDPPKLWAENGVKKLAPAARQFLCLPPASVLSEGLLSGAGFTYSDCCSCLHLEKAEILVFIHTNMAGSIRATELN